MQETCYRNSKRLLALFLFLAFLFCLLIMQFFRIQILEGEKWSKAAKAQHQLIICEPCKRGLFYSNTSMKQGHLEKPLSFVVDIPKFHLYIDPSQIPLEDCEEMVHNLCTFLPSENISIHSLRLQCEKKSRSRKLAEWIEPQRVDQIQQWWFHFAHKKKLARNALFFIKDYQRSYPFGKLLGSVLHSIRSEKDALTDQKIPTGGLEFLFDHFLRGKNGEKLILRSPKHPLETGKILSYPEDGADLYLTVNHYLQAVAEEEICKAVKNANAKSGWAILMEPRTGEIWALAQYPDFNPGEYRTYFNNPALAEYTRVKAITDPYEPASTMKPITLAIALKASNELKKKGKPPFSPKEKIATANGGFPGRSKPIRDIRSHRYLNMYMALQKSSNIYCARLIQRVIEGLGDQWYRDALRDIFGFGIKTGIELPSESPGALPMPGKLHPNGKMQWSTPTPYSIAFGHNILANSFQMLRAYALFANGGFDVQPTLLRKIIRTHRDGTEEILLDNTRSERIKSHRLLEPEIVKEVVKAMKYTTKPGGTAPKADIWGYTEAGKTATSEKIVNGIYSKTNHISTFIGFAPLNAPRFVLLIAIDEPEFKYIPGIGKNQYGGNCAAPCFREIGLRTLQYLGVEPDDPYGYPVGDPRRDPEKADWLKEVKALKELYSQWNS